jgi:hypothetical protein
MPLELSQAQSKQDNNFFDMTAFVVQGTVSADVQDFVALAPCLIILLRMNSLIMMTKLFTVPLSSSSPSDYS